MVDRGRGDFWMMMIHHVLAVALLTGSFWGNAHRVGTTVVFEQVSTCVFPELAGVCAVQQRMFWCIYGAALCVRCFATGAGACVDTDGLVGETERRISRTF